MNELATLTAAEADLLGQAEATIERGIRTFVEVGQALASIRDNRLYRAEHGTFDAYCQERWGFDRNRAWQLISAAGVTTNVISQGLPAPANEGQARALAQVPEAERADVWRETLDRTEGKPTAAAVAATWQERREPEPDAIDDVPLPFDEPEREEVHTVAAPAVLELTPEQKRANAEFVAAVRESGERQQQEVLELLAKQEAANAFGRASDGLLSAVSYAAAFRPPAEISAERIDQFIARTERLLETARTWKEQPA